MTMDLALLRDACRRHQLFLTPELNDILYASNLACSKLGGLDPYINLKTLFADGNALSSLEGLPALPQLACLYLQQNCIATLTESPVLPSLEILNLAGNALESIDGLGAAFPTLQTLILTNNRLAGNLSPLRGCPGLTTLDLSCNRLEDGEGLLSTLRNLPDLRSLYLHGNADLRDGPHWRRRVVAALTGLTYLDSRPITPLERACAEAW